jgi:hypothetical protein
MYYKISQVMFRWRDAELELFKGIEVQDIP